MGGSPHTSYSCPIPLILCFSSRCQPPGISSSISEHHTCTAYLNPSAEKTFCPEVAQRETYSSPSRLSSLRSRSSRHTSDQRRPSTRGYCSGKPGIPGGCGARRLQGWTRRTCSAPPGTDALVKTGTAATKGCCHGESVSLSFPTWYRHERQCRWGSCRWRGTGTLVAEPGAESGCPGLLL